VKLAKLLQYSDSGWFTCAGYPGSYGNEEKDAYTFFTDWNFDYIKYDNCASGFRQSLQMHAH
jgi:alpha-galactosidase